MSAFIRFFAILVFIAIVLVGFVFSVNNTTEVPLWVGVELAPQRVGIWIMLAFITGGFLGLLLGFGLFSRIKYKLQVSQLRARLKTTEKRLQTSIEAAEKETERP